MKSLLTFLALFVGISRSIHEEHENLSFFIFNSSEHRNETVQSNRPLEIESWDGDDYTLLSVIYGRLLYKILRELTIRQETISTLIKQSQPSISILLLDSHGHESINLDVISQMFRNGTKNVLISPAVLYSIPIELVETSNQSLSNSIFIESIPSSNSFLARSISRRDPFVFKIDTPMYPPIDPNFMVGDSGSPTFHNLIQHFVQVHQNLLTLFESELKRAMLDFIKLRGVKDNKVGKFLWDELITNEQLDSIKRKDLIPFVNERGAGLLRNVTDVLLNDPSKVIEKNRIFPLSAGIELLIGNDWDTMKSDTVHNPPTVLRKFQSVWTAVQTLMSVELAIFLERYINGAQPYMISPATRRAIFSTNSNHHRICIFQAVSNEGMFSDVRNSTAVKSTELYARLHGLPKIVYGNQGEFQRSPWRDYIRVIRDASNGRDGRNYYAKFIALLELMDSTERYCEWFVFLDLDVMITSMWSSLDALISDVVPSSKHFAIVFRDLNFENNGNLLNSGIFFMRNSNDSREALIETLQTVSDDIYEVWHGGPLLDQTSLIGVLHRPIHASLKQILHKSNPPAPYLTDSLTDQFRNVIVNLVFFFFSPWFIESPRGYRYSHLPETEIHPHGGPIFLSQRLGNSFIPCFNTMRPPDLAFRYLLGCPNYLVNHLREKWPSAWLPHDVFAHAAGCNKITSHLYFNSLFNEVVLNNYRNFPSLDNILSNTRMFPNEPLLQLVPSDAHVFPQPLVTPIIELTLSDDISNRLLHQRQHYRNDSSYIGRRYIILELTPSVRDMLTSSIPEHRYHSNCDGSRDITLLDLAFSKNIYITIFCIIPILILLLRRIHFTKRKLSHNIYTDKRSN